MYYNTGTPELSIAREPCYLIQGVPPQMLEAEGYKQFLNSSEVIEILVHFITLCGGPPCVSNW